MPPSTITSKDKRPSPTVPREVRDALDLEPGDKLTWEVRGGKVAVTTERPAPHALKGLIKHGEPDAAKAVAPARKTRGRV